MLATGFINQKTKKGHNNGIIHNNYSFEKEQYEARIKDLQEINSLLREKVTRLTK